MKEKKHIFIGKNGKAEKYTYPGTVVTRNTIPPQERAAHGGKLSSQLSQLKNKEAQIISESQDYGLESVVGIQLSFESYPGVELAFEKLADARKGIEILNVTEMDGKTTATVLMPTGSVSVLEKKIAAYLDSNQDNRNGPKNAQLLNAINEIKQTVIENLWTDAPELYPSSNDEIGWFEIWLPVRDDRTNVIEDFKKLCTVLDIIVSESTLEFPERTVLLVKTSLNRISNSSLLLSYISEIRKSKTTAEFFDHLPIEDQSLWVDDLLKRAQIICDNNSPFVSILDSGVNIGHPLLKPFSNTNNIFHCQSNVGCC